MWATYLLLSGIIALIIDYSRMLYLRWRMVVAYSFASFMSGLSLIRQQPPGPLPWPIVGNTFSLPDEKPWYLMEQLSKQYKSPLITFWIGRLVPQQFCRSEQ